MVIYALVLRKVTRNRSKCVLRRACRACVLQRTWSACVLRGAWSACKACNSYNLHFINYANLLPFYLSIRNSLTFYFHSGLYGACESKIILRHTMVVSGVFRHRLLDLQPQTSTISGELYFYSRVSIDCSAIFLPSNAKPGFTLRSTNQ